MRKGTSANLHRRHMSPGQQAAIVASAQDWAKAQTVGKPKSGNATGLDTVASRAARSGASDKTQRMADKVAKEAPDLAKKVAHGEVSLPAVVKEDLSAMGESTSEFGPARFESVREFSRAFPNHLQTLPEPSVWGAA